MATTAEKEVLLSVPGTTRLVNETFTDELTDPNSESFQEIENHICSQVMKPRYVSRDRDLLLAKNNL